MFDIITNYEAIAAFSALTSTIILFISAFIGIPAYLINNRNSRIERTWAIIDVIHEPMNLDVPRDVYKETFETKKHYLGPYHIELNEKQHDELKKLFNMYERIALGINTNFYDFTTFERFWGIALIREWTLFHSWVCDRRIKSEYYGFLCETELLVKKLKIKTCYKAPFQSPNILILKNI